MALASTVPVIDAHAGSGSPTQTLRSLPRGGVIEQASLAQSVHDPENYPVRRLPLSLSDGYFLTRGYEGQPAPNVSKRIIYARVDHEYLLIQVWFGQQHPTPLQTCAAEAELARLVVPTR
jgi:hypothetical protein